VKRRQHQVIRVLVGAYFVAVALASYATLVGFVSKGPHGQAVRGTVRQWLHLPVGGRLPYDEVGR
jgi:hypothetical protein